MNAMFLIALTTLATLSAVNLDPTFDWLENEKNPKTIEWVETQKAKFDEYIKQKPTIEEAHLSLKKWSNSESFSLPRKNGDYYFFTAKKSPEERGVLYIQKGIDEEPSPLLDLNHMDASISLEGFVISPDGKSVAYGLSKNGSDWTTWHVRVISTLIDLPDTVERIKFSPVVWGPESEGFFYSRFEKDGHCLFYHKIGTSQTADIFIYQNKGDGSVGYSPFISADNRYLIIDAFTGSSGPNSINYLDLSQPNQQVKSLIPTNGANQWYVGSEGTKLYFLTNLHAPFRKVISVDIASGVPVMQDIISESSTFIESVVPVGCYFAVVGSHEVKHSLKLYDREGELKETIALPSIGKVLLSPITQNTPQLSKDLFFSFTNFFHPKTIYRYNLQSSKLQVFRNSGLELDTNQYELKQVFYSSKDGTKIPMFIAYKKGLELDGKNPTLLTGYGAYGISNYPTFTAFTMTWLERGGVYALANIRGGNEYGEEWHKGALREKKQNSFDDFIGAAEFLISHKYTSPEYLAAKGASSGGLLVSASANQRPDLFKAIVVEVGLLDMLRFHLFTIGRFWINEHGNPEVPEDYAFLRKYSPCHNVPSVKDFPAVLVVASENDDRVVPSHSYKYLAALQAANPENNKLFLLLNSGAGHDGSKSNGRGDVEMDILTFLMQETE